MNQAKQALPLQKREVAVIPKSMIE